VELDDPLVALVLIDLKKSSLISSNIDMSLWDKHENFESLFSEHWMYSYEAYVNGEVSTSEKYINKSNFFKALETYSVRFYDSSLQIEIEPFESLEDEFNIKVAKAINEIKAKLKVIQEKGVNSEKIETIKELVEDLSFDENLTLGNVGYF
jgi:hypothetical protein